MQNGDSDTTKDWNSIEIDEDTSTNLNGNHLNSQFKLQYMDGYMILNFIIQTKLIIMIYLF